MLGGKMRLKKNAGLEKILIFFFITCVWLGEKVEWIIFLVKKKKKKG